MWHNLFVDCGMRYLVLLFSIYTIGCNNEAAAPSPTKDSAQPDGTELNDTALRTSIDTNTIIDTKVPVGFYRAILPCEGCGGIEHTIHFLSNKTYKLEETKLGKAPQTSVTFGSFNPSSGTIWAYKGQVVKARYTWKADTLHYLLPDNRQIAMQKLTAATDNDAWRRKGKEGLAFYGVGNEPFWNLEIGKRNTIAFHQSEWTQPLRFTNISTLRQGDSILYTAASDSAALKVTVYNRFCSDGMSDFIYTHNLKVVFNGKTFTGCGIMY